MALVLALLVVSVPAPAVAQGAPTVTLEASDTRLDLGQSTRLHGRITPEAEDELIHIVDDAGNQLAVTRTDADGRYSVRISPRNNVTVHAEWSEMFSDSIPIKVRPRLQVDLGTVRLFDVARVWGDISPGNVTNSVKIELRRYGKTTAVRMVDPRDSGYFKAKLPIDEPGTYRVKASYRSGDHLDVASRTDREKTHLPSLSSGSHSIFVKLLEKRLRELNYRGDPSPDQHFDHRTSDGLIAFNKVQRRTRVGYVTDSTWNALADPIKPKPKFASPKYHIEVDQTKQVLYRVFKGEVITILHVSTGAGSATRDGTFRVWSKLAGYSRKRLYYPSFFDGARGIHGWPSVPTYNASHGCVRIPMWTAVWMYGKSEIGTTVRIYH